MRAGPRGTEPHPDGGVRHRGDPRASGVQSIMMDEASQQAYFRAIRCPSLLVISDTFVQHYDHHKPNPHYQLFMDRVAERRAAFGASLEVVSLPGCLWPSPSPPSPAHQPPEFLGYTHS